MHQHVHIDMLEKIKEIMHFISTEDPPSHCRDSSFSPPIIPSTDPAPQREIKIKERAKPRQNRTAWPARADASLHASAAHCNWRGPPLTRVSSPAAVTRNKQ